MEKLFDLPKAIQKKVLEFQKKFRENSTSEAIHFEPIKEFKDPNLRTARIDLKYRIIIRVPDSGDSYYLLWVDNHDEAMDWAKNKIFQWNENTQTAQIFTAPENTPETSIETPIKDLTLFSGYSKEQLILVGVPDTLIELVKSIKTLDELGEAEKYLPPDAFENLFYISEGLNINLLIAEINEGKTSSTNIDDQIKSANNKRSFVEVDDKLMNDIINGDLYKWQIFLHPSQRYLVDTNFKSSVKVTGGAGTGKTVVSLHRLKNLSTQPDDGDSRKVVFTTFTNALTTNLISLAKKLDVNFSKVQIANIDTLARELAIEYKLIEKSTRILDFYLSKSSEELWDEVLEQTLTEFDTAFLCAEYQNVILYNNINELDSYLKVSRIGRVKPLTRKQKMEIWAVIESYNSMKHEQKYLDRMELFNIVSNYFKSSHLHPFKNVIADEIQDLSNVELRFLRSLVEQKGNDLFLVGDPYQKIYARQINFSSVGISIKGTRSKQLRINYRTSEEIKRLAISAVKEINYDDFDGETEKLNGYLSLFHGEKPTYKIFKTKTEEIDSIIENIKNLRESGLQYCEIAIGFRTKDSLKELKTTLHKLKIPYADNTNSSSNDTTGIILSTFHSLKGLEFKAVFLSDVNNRTCPLFFAKLNQFDDKQKEEYFKSERALMYVAISRAINILHITGTGVKSELISV
jgi:hypothetical protein